MSAPGCTISGCGAQTVARGWCGKHYQRWYKWGDPLFSSYQREQPRHCRGRACRRKPYAFGLCHKHYQRFKRWGDPNYTVYECDPERASENGRRASSAVKNHIAGRRTDGRTHGSSGTYGVGCRCALCRAAERDRKRIQRALRVPPPESATLSELEILIAQQERDDRTLRLSYAASLDALAESGIEAAYFDSDDDESTYRAVRSRRAKARSI